MDKTLIILRGCSGSGKSFFANYLADLAEAEVCSADSFFEDENGNYNFDASKLFQAHRQCLKDVEDSMKYDQLSPIIVANTNTREKEIKPYIELANKYNYNVVSLVVENRHGGQNQHNVPEKTLKDQEQRLKNSIKLL